MLTVPLPRPALLVLAITFNVRICCSKHPGGALEVDAKDWAHQVLQAQAAHKDPLDRAAEAARRSAIAASDAAAAAAAAVSLSQREAGWYHRGPGAKQPASPHHQQSLVSLATAAEEKKDAVKAYAAVSAAKIAAAEMKRAQALADSVERTRKEIAKLGQQQKQQASSAEPDSAEANLYKGEVAAAQTAVGCIVVLCIVISWFTASSTDSHRRKQEGFFERHKLLCCCCREIACLGHCVFGCVSCIGRCNCTTITMMLMILAMVVFGFKSLWDRHLIQPHLEEATIYLFFGTVALTIILVLLGEFVRWLKEKIHGLTEFTGYARDKIDNVKDFLGLDDSDSEEEQNNDVSIFKDDGLHAKADSKLTRPGSYKAKPQQYQAGGRQVERRQKNACGPGWLVRLFAGGTRRSTARHTPKAHHDRPRDDSDMDAV